MQSPFGSCSPRWLAVLGLLVWTGCGTDDFSDDFSDVAPSLWPPEAAVEAGEGMDPELPGIAVSGRSGGKADDPVEAWPSTAPLPRACDEQTPLRVFFTPDDPVETLELSMIERVRAARRKSGESFAEGQNPYRIRYATYNLSHVGIQTALVAAERDGVDVQVLIEADQLDKPWSTISERFTRGGLEVEPDHHALDATDRIRADLVGIADEGLMHLKMRLFETPDDRSLLTGSHNPNQTAAANDENLNVIEDPVIIDRYARAYDAVLERQPLVNEWDDASALNVMFSPVGKGERASNRLLDWLEEEEEQILLMVFSLRNITSPDSRRSLLKILRQKVVDGVPVYVITDRKQSDGVDLHGNRVYDDHWLDDELREAGIPVYEVLNDASAYFGRPSDYAAMHHKVAVLGLERIRVITDAANWTTSALGSWRYTERNVESMLFIDSYALDGNATGHRYMAQWMRVLARWGHQSERIDAERPPADIARELLATPGWPTVPVSFGAEAYTAYGEQVSVVGDLDALGAWGEQHPGLALDTSADTYPRWSSPKAVELPLGHDFEWKLTARGPDGLRWQPGRNQKDFAVPDVCGEGATVWAWWW